MSPINLFEMKAIIKVVGVGGAGCNAVNRMVSSGVQGVDFLALNTDVQSLSINAADVRMPIGARTTQGRGSGGNPEVGEKSALEAEKQIVEALEGSDLVFITAGMGGGTGTGAAPVVARVARSRGILTVAVVSKPFGFEGRQRMKTADLGIDKLRPHVDALIVVPNERLQKIAGKRITMAEAFNLGDEALQAGVEGISSIILSAGDINRDFADVAAVLRDSGQALMGMGRGIGDRKARDAAETAVNSPLMDAPLQGVMKLLVNVSHGPDYTMHEHAEAMEYLNQFLDPHEGTLYIGTEERPELAGEVRITVVAAGIQGESRPADPEVFQEEAPRTGRRVTEDTDQEVKARSRGAAPGPLDTPIDLDEIEAGLPSFLQGRAKK